MANENTDEEVSQFLAHAAYFKLTECEGHYEFTWKELCTLVILQSPLACFGCSEMLMACAVNAEAAKTPGKEAVAMEAFARALQTLPTIIADNAGYDSAQLISELRAAHSQGQNTMGLNMNEGKIGCMKQLGITESFVVKRQVLLSAAEAAEMILRVDNIIKAAPRKRVEDRGHC